MNKCRRVQIFSPMDCVTPNNLALELGRGLAGSESPEHLPDLFDPFASVSL